VASTQAVTVKSLGALVAGPPTRTFGCPLGSPSKDKAVSVSASSKPGAPQPSGLPWPTAVTPRDPRSWTKVTGVCSDSRR
jgi:hypothetical protein